MRTAAAREVPVALRRIHRRLERWRRTRRGRDRIPGELWDLAVEAVGAYGLNKTARALGLDYYSLKKRVESAAGDSGGLARQRGPQAPPVAGPVEVAPRFVEWASGVAGLVPARSSGVPEGLLKGHEVFHGAELAARTAERMPECLLEFERADGMKLRVHFKGVTALDLAALGRSLWGDER